ncbi:DUF4169 family protein [Sphingomonas kyeonggiensis]|uniref:GR25 family glycosyltransferase involved in LPS biosynthesis n=1 Tax=Sphingomonas kyeonggiensis TaxID=1268553 RepID=A0A7W6JUP8_9SPHN|nr:DUF4169 family protein [Sphingomonas kyeonggiensis]MBB4099866.1 GR25 family glycosyltransferase involved in LPS biosynthesis [Sphingomonas kyeonggiensis]
MAEIINLNRARKAKARVDKSARAEENRARFGRNKAEKQAEAAEKARIARTLDDAKRD